MGKLTLSVDDTVVERAKAYAERHRTSVSAMVEEYLAEVTGGAMPLGEEGGSADIAALGEFGGRVLTDVDGPVRTSPQQRQLAAYLDNGWLLVARADPLNPHVMALRATLRKLGYEVTRQVLVDLDVVRQVYERAASGPGAARAATKMQTEFLALIRQAAEQKASDVHIVVERHEATVRMRIDGAMRHMASLPAPFAHDLLVSAFNMADASDSCYRPYEYQAARISGISASLPDGLQGVRIQYNPLPDGGRYGIFHLLWRWATKEGDLEGGLEALGYSPAQIATLRRVSARSYGLNLVSGPTGSGKSTTLACTLTDVIERHHELNVVSVEDPVEYVIRGCTQMPVTNASTEEARNEKLRQSIMAAMHSRADTLMIGELRDRASATLAFQASMVGHQVWTTIHANSALAIIGRLRAIGVEDYKLADHNVVSLLIGQRLVRKLCPHCRVPLRRTDHPDVFDWLEGKDPDAPRCAFVASEEGCEHCHGGYSGRTIVAEVIETDALLLGAIVKNDWHAVREYLKDRGVQTMLEHALSKVCDGLIDPRDVQDRVGL